MYFVVTDCFAVFVLSSRDLQKFASNPVSENMTSRIELLDIYKNMI